MAPILGVIFAILVSTLSLPSLLSWLHQSKESAGATLVAQQARQFNAAAMQFMRANAAALQATASATSTATVSVPDLQTAGLLPPTFAATNALGQTWQLEILEPTPGNLQALATTTGGPSLSDSQAVNISKQIGSNGGFFPKNDTGRYVDGTPKAHGSTWGPLRADAYSAEPGHLASLLVLNSNAIADNHLYRVSLPGQPQFNTMSTPLIMSVTQAPNTSCTQVGAIARDIAGALLSCHSDAGSTVWKESSGSGSWKEPVTSFSSFSLLPIGQAIGSVRITEDTGRAYMWNGSDWVSLVSDQNGALWVPGGLSAADASIHTGYTSFSGPYIELSHFLGPAWATALRNDNGNFQIRNLTVDQSGNMSTSAVHASELRLNASSTSTVGEICTELGLIAKDATDTLMYCRQGTWARLSGGVDWGACRKISVRGSDQRASCDNGEVMVNHSFWWSYGSTCSDQSTSQSAAMDCSSYGFNDVAATVKCCPRLH